MTRARQPVPFRQKVHSRRFAQGQYATDNVSPSVPRLETNRDKDEWSGDIRASTHDFNVEIRGQSCRALLRRAAGATETNAFHCQSTAIDHAAPDQTNLHAIPPRKSGGVIEVRAASMLSGVRHESVQNRGAVFPADTETRAAAIQLTPVAPHFWSVCLDCVQSESVDANG